MPIHFPGLDAATGHLVRFGILDNGATDASPPGPGTFYVSALGVTGNNPSFVVSTNCLSAQNSPTGKHCMTFHTFFPFAPQGGFIVHMVFTLGAGVNVVTFTNTAGDP